MFVIVSHDRKTEEVSGGFKQSRYSRYQLGITKYLRACYGLQYALVLMVFIIVFCSLLVSCFLVWDRVKNKKTTCLVVLCRGLNNGIMVRVPNRLNNSGYPD
uniref:Uncharacterized protein n=1 Tax=Cacopsylla melanoneura TaxID=428564 RepID=A0A8D9F5A7_9HEMI